MKLLVIDPTASTVKAVPSREVLKESIRTGTIALTKLLLCKFPVTPRRV